MNISIPEVQELDFDVHRRFYRDAYIYGYMQTEKGRDYLERAWILQQTKPDREELRNHFQKAGD